MATCCGRRLCRAKVLVPVAILVLLVLVPCLVSLQHLGQPPLQQEPLTWDVAELQLNLTGSRQGPGLRWQAGPALGRSFLLGPELDQGQLRIRREGIYRLHIQVTLANCSAARTPAPVATLAVSVCSPAARRLSLLRRSFHRDCVVASQRLTPLARGDRLCTDLAPTPLLPSPSADQTFLGVQWVHP